MSMFKVTIGIRDDKGRKGNFRFYVDVSAIIGNPLPTLQQFVDEVSVELDKVINGRVTTASASLQLARPPGMKALPTVDADIEERIRMLFNTFGTTRYKGEIPAFNHALLPPGSETFNPDDLFFSLGNHLMDLLGEPDSRGYNLLVVNQYGEEIGRSTDGIKVFRP